jgi:hypothetical protein
MNAQPSRLGDVTVRVEPGYPLGFSGNAMDEFHGYAEYRFTIHNFSPTTSHRVSLTLPKSSSFGIGAYLRALTRTVEVQPDEQLSLSLFQPNLPFGYGLGSLEVAIDGRTMEDAVNVGVRSNPGLQRRGGPSSGAGMFRRRILTASGDLNVLNSNVFKSAVGKPIFKGSSTFGMQSGMYRNQQYSYVPVYAFDSLSASSGSDFWLGYSSYDGVVLRPKNLDALRPGARAALWQYVECGGSLLIVGPFTPPPAWNSTRSRLGGLTVYYPGFGQCLVIDEKDIAKWEPEHWQAITAMWDLSALPWQKVDTANGAQRRFPVVENNRIPVRTLFTVMLVFAIVIGPVNVFVLSRKPRRFWLLWTVPLISFLTCAGVVAFMTLIEGWQAQARIEGMTILDENARHACSVGWLGLYTPRTPEGGLHFHPDTELSPHMLSPANVVPRNTPRTIDWTDDQNLTSGWLSARVPAHFLVRSSRDREEHLGVSREADGSLSLVNALGAPIRAVWVADEAGKLYTASAIPVEGKTSLAPTSQKAAGAGAGLRQAYSQEWLQLVERVSAAPEAYLRPGCYLAVLEGAPFFQTGLRSATLRPGQSVVLGIMKAQ